MPSVSAHLKMPSIRRKINCVDGSVLFASLLRAINITPVLIQIPRHMFVGYYTDASKKHLEVLETTMIGDVDLDDYFPEERLDSTMQGRSQGEMSRLTFEKSKEYAAKEYAKYEKADSFQQTELHVRGNFEACAAVCSPSESETWIIAQITKTLQHLAEACGISSEKVHCHAKPNSLSAARGRE